MHSSELTRILLSLTRRQREVLELVAEGLTNRQIADRLFIEPCVVAGHLTSIYGIIAPHLFEACITTNRYTVIRIFSPYFAQNPEYRTSAAQTRN